VTQGPLLGPPVISLLLLSTTTTTTKYFLNDKIKVIRHFDVSKQQQEMTHTADLQGTS